MKLDLHVHTTYSDGQYSPEQVVDLAVRTGLDGISITDHDGVNGIDKAIERSSIYNGFLVIPGIEFSCDYNGEEVHILGYYIDYSSNELIDILKILNEERIKRGQRIIYELNKIGLDISIDDVKKYTENSFIGRPHIANTIVEKKYADNIKDAFNRYLIQGRPGYVKRYKLSIDKTVQLIKDIGGIAVLAHPGLLKDSEAIFYSIDNGIDGIEAIHSKHSKVDTQRFINIAKDNSLIVTGGSDFHGGKFSDDNSLGKYYVDISHIEILKRRHKLDNI